MGGVCGTSPTDMDGKASKSAPDERYIIYQLLYYEEVKLKSGCVTRAPLLLLRSWVALSFKVVSLCYPILNQYLQARTTTKTIQNWLSTTKYLSIHPYTDQIHHGPSTTLFCFSAIRYQPLPPYNDPVHKFSIFFVIASFSSSPSLEPTGSSYNHSWSWRFFQVWSL